MRLWYTARVGKGVASMRAGAPGAEAAEAADPAVREWRRILAVHAAVSCALDHELGTRHGLGASEYEVLERLAEGPECAGWRVQDIADAVHLSQSAVSRLIGRLERDGLVMRTMCAEDRRGIYVALTDVGRSRYEEARPTHRAVLATHLA
jgi:DNA-binding MarR family transcriptional regulator